MNTPALRFPGFVGEWEEKRLGEVATKIMYGIGSAATEYDGINKYLWITDIDESSRAFIPNPLTSPDGIIDTKYKLESDDIVFARTGVSVGKSYLYNLKDGNLIFAGFLIKFNIQHANSYFIYLNTFRDYYKNWVQVMSVRSGQPGINAEEYKLLPINLPPLLEQQKIASFLSAVDAKISQITQKGVLLGEYKRGVMQGIFSQEIRFLADDGSVFGDWVERRLGDLCETIKSGGTPRSTTKEYYNGNIPFLSISDMTKQGKYLTSTSKNISQIGIDNSSSWIVPIDTIIYSMYASVGFVSINKIPIATSQAVINLILKDGYSIEFVYYHLIELKKTIHRFIETGTQGNLNAQTVKSLILNIPSLPEQTKIANFLSAIDRKIAQNTQSLEKMKTFKRGLLQGMFA